ncbi:hypothetical protein DN752_04360 [Echinicola strongylocentroti]|uniref:Type I restriction modification DNA specificity domain-containing protein n=1 Tax=Echinicola strongylocentroti TaxID=1795355 RepID=A0A2Z4IFG8_9BACT|nr:restriction endonuclease subunit S [Echinicola strongylocentroti]AWW29437.1 hypothetical protein DN752_04360 [Echinicola strongylocentroti]
MNKEKVLLPSLRFPKFKENREWIKKSIGSIAKVSAGGTPSSGETKYWGGNIPWMNSGELNLKRVYAVENKITEIGLKESSTKKIPPLCVLIGLAGQGKTRGTAAINYIELCTNQSIAAIHPNQKKFDSEFLFHKIDSLYQKLRSLSTGQGGRGGLNLSIIREIEIPLPSIPEQQEIASCLSSLDELIAAHKDKLLALKDHKKGLLQNLFPQEGATVPKVCFPEFEGDGEWELKQFSKFIKLYRGSSPRPIKEFLTQSESGVNWIKIGDTSSVTDFVLRSVSEKITPKGAKKSRPVKKGELILANSMSYGSTYILEVEGCIYDGWFVLREYEDFFDKQFLLQLLNSEYTQSQYKKYAAGGIVQNISSEIVYSIILPKTSKKEQQKIASCLSAVDELISAQREKIEQLQQHKKGLMQGLFPKIEN